MRTTQSLSITLPIEMAEMVKAKVASGEYATESEVIRDGLRTLLARDAAIEKWLVEEVVPTLDAIDADPSKARPLEDARKRLHARIDKMVEAKQ
ncbi:type II toxin-antitoxin system ParD family antitoxin [Rhizobium sp. XQZ8]|uniref:ribbon-helix-helix domain-containing protein n=1 Tax=Rhizobium populisoli TaxID=2859785 RepID=UPI001C66C7C9|nr:type II toxin-antitoxin system ParD family antitoxin [Rhizobium populisoli]MBW6421102.1 type II toxin-antitoxin system ParD family antitoxin [Rhizobium populisoli]